MTTRPLLRLSLFGVFRLASYDGDPIVIPSRRGMALIAMLATAGGGIRTRAWLQDRLWSSRGLAQAQASLRRELTNLKTALGSSYARLLSVDRFSVRLTLDNIEIEHAGTRSSPQEFLEGFDLPGSEGFEDWLREERRMIAAEREAAAAFRPGESSITLPGAPVAMSGRPTLSVLVEHQELPVELAALLEGIAGDMAERIARLRWLPVVGAPAGTLRIDNPESLSRVGRLLAADYLLHCRMGIGRTFLLALSETRSGRLLRSNRYELGEPVSIGELERIATDAVAALSLQIATDQQDRVRDRRIQQLNADELVWRARWHIRRLTREDARIADELLEMAAAAQPDSAEVMLEQAYAKAWRLWAQGAPFPPIETLRRRVVLARDIDPYDARGWLLLGILDMWLCRHESAADLMREAIKLNPSLSFAYGHLGSCYSLAGRPEDAIPLLRTALRLSPLDTQNFHQFGELSLAQLMLGNHAEAVAEADSALARRTRYSYGHVLKTAALWLNGEHARAREAGAAFLGLRPSYDPIALDWLPFRDRSWNNKLQEAVSAVLQTERARLRGGDKAG